VCQNWSSRSGRTEASNCLTLEDSSGFGKSWCLNTASAAGGAAAINGPVDGIQRANRFTLNLRVHLRPTQAYNHRRDSVTFGLASQPALKLAMVVGARGNITQQPGRRGRRHKT